MITSTTELLKLNKVLIAFNVSSLEAVKAVLKASKVEGQDIIVSTSKNEATYVGPEIVHSLVSKIGDDLGLRCSLHLDHGDDLDFIKKVLDAGYTSIHFDGGELDLDENIEKTKKVVELCKKYNASVEGEVGCVRKEGEQSGEDDFTNPENAERFVGETGVDLLAISLGNQHGADKKVREVRYDIADEVHKLIPDVPLVLHGGSFMKKEVLKKLIKSGIQKININSELRLAFSNQIKRNLEEDPDEYKPYKIMDGVEEEVFRVVREKMIQDLRFKI